MALGFASWLTSSTCPSPWFTCWSKWEALQTQVLSASCWLAKQIHSHHSQVLACQWKYLNFPKLKKYGAPRYLTMPCSPLREPGTQTLTLHSSKIAFTLSSLSCPTKNSPNFLRQSHRFFRSKDTHHSWDNCFWKKQLHTHMYIHAHNPYPLLEHK